MSPTRTLTGGRAGVRRDAATALPEWEPLPLSPARAAGRRAAVAVYACWRGWAPLDPTSTPLAPLDHAGDDHPGQPELAEALREFCLELAGAIGALLLPGPEEHEELEDVLQLRIARRRAALSAAGSSPALVHALAEAAAWQVAEVLARHQTAVSWLTSRFANDEELEELALFRMVLPLLAAVEAPLPEALGDLLYERWQAAEDTLWDLTMAPYPSDREQVDATQAARDALFAWEDLRGFAAEEGDPRPAEVRNLAASLTRV